MLDCYWRSLSSCRRGGTRDPRGGTCRAALLDDQRAKSAYLNDDWSYTTKQGILLAGSITQDRPE